MRSWASCASSTPWSQVRDRDSCSGQGGDGRGDRVSYGLSAVAGERRAVFDSGTAVVVHARQVEQHGEPSGPFDKGADGGAVEADDEVAKLVKAAPAPASRAFTF